MPFRGGKLPGMKIAVAIALLLIAQTPKPGADIVAKLKLLDEKRKELVKQLEPKIAEADAIIANMKVGRISPKISRPVRRGKSYSFPNQAARHEAVKKAEAERERLKNRLLALKAGELPAEALDDRPLVGDIGTLHQNPIVGDSLEIYEIIDATTMRVEFRRDRQVIVKGIPTKGLADEDNFFTDKVFWVSGTHMEFGSTYLVFHALDDKFVRAAIAGN